MLMGTKDNIVLIGMPGAGKSTVGVVLAKVLGCRFLDSDLVIQEETGGFFMRSFRRMASTASWR